jgi:DNA-binding Lrp family transcriptional regulator
MDRDRIRQHLLDRYQRGFPLAPRPYQQIADDLGVTEADILTLFGALKEENAISRIGAVVRPNTIGASTLAAMQVPEALVEDVGVRLGSRAEVNHCYSRDHPYNLWFVVTARDRGEVRRVLDELQEETGYALLALPMLKDYHIDLGFRLP